MSSKPKSPTATAKTAALSPKEPALHARRRMWPWFLLTAALIALLFSARGIAASIVHSAARARIAERQPEEALEWLNWCDRIDTRDGEAAFLRARAYRKLGQFDEVRKHLQRAHKLGIAVPRLDREQILASAQSGQMTEAEPFMSELLTNPGDDAEEICEAFVQGFAVNRRFSDAFRLLEPWIADFPGKAHPYYVRGNLQLELLQTKEAEVDLRKAVSLDPNHLAANFGLGDALQKQNKPAEALPYFRVAAKSPRLEVLARTAEVKCLSILGQRDEALNVIREVVRKHPSEPEPHKSLGQFQLEAGNFAEALQQFDLAMPALGYDTELRNSRGSALRGLKRLEEAKQEFEYVRQANAELARSHDLRDKILTDPTNHQLRFEVGKILIKYSVPQDGVLWLQSVFNYVPHHRGAHQTLADYYAVKAQSNPAFAKLAEFHRKEAQSAAAQDPAPATDNP